MSKMVNRSRLRSTSVALSLSGLLFACGAPPAARGGAAAPAPAPTHQPNAASQAMPADPSAQPYSLDDVEDMVRGGMRTVRILDLVRSDCIGFDVTGDVISRLTAAGADDALITGLRSTCKRL